MASIIARTVSARPSLLGPPIQVTACVKALSTTAPRPQAPFSFGTYEMLDVQAGALGVSSSADWMMPRTGTKADYARKVSLVFGWF